MSLLGEELAEEWLNRQGYFTIRGIKVGTGEIDLLAARASDGNATELWHYEVQASLRPVSYLCAAPIKLRKEGKSAHNAKKRPQDEIQRGVDEWVNKKYRNPRKTEIRERLWPGKWSFGLIIGNVKYPEELRLIQEQGIHIVFLHDIIRDITPKWSDTNATQRLAAAGGADLIDPIFAHDQLKPPPQFD